MTQVLKMSWVHNRRLYISSRNRNNSEKKAFYGEYCAILSKVIKEARASIVACLIAKVKTLWNIVNNLEYLQTNWTVHTIDTSNNFMTDHLPTSNVFRKSYCANIKFFNSLPMSLKIWLKGAFWTSMKKLLYLIHSFCLAEVLLMFKNCS